ncbi:hypothetical protein Nepgr_006512 [Nepenthes gracilis]|uniref:U-box domain-containing protein n=1 Tax=Nepenthes gracilis TaxID=150966 RepID=A0AAD3S546_NEPGR|nr:hypothetical protein Nepgr_006512 [Nepenthes gracilis]
MLTIEKNVEVEYIDQPIALLMHIHDHLVAMKQPQCCTLVPISTSFCCILSLELMTNPSNHSPGQTYARAHSQKWLNLRLTVYLKARQTLDHMNLLLNYTCKAFIADWCKKNNVKLPGHMKSMSLNQPLAVPSHPNFGAFKDLNITHSSVMPPPLSPEPTQSIVVDERNSSSTPRGDTTQTSQSPTTYSSDDSKGLPKEQSPAVAAPVSIPSQHAIPLALLMCCQGIMEVIAVRKETLAENLSFCMIHMRWKPGRGRRGSDSPFSGIEKENQTGHSASKPLPREEG